MNGTFAVKGFPMIVMMLAIGSQAGGRTAHAQHQVEMSTKAPEARLPDGVASVRIPLRTVLGHIVLPVSVNGSEPLPVILDTGMPMPGLLLFQGPRVDSLPLEYATFEAQVGGAGGEGAHMPARVATGARVGLGDASIGNAQVLILPPIAHMPMLHAGVIGAAVFRNFTVQVDYDRQEIVLWSPDRYTPSPTATPVPLDLKGNLPYVEAAVGDAGGKEVPVRLVLDLGATHAVSLNRTSHEGVDLPDGAIPSRIGRGVSGEVTGHVGRIGSFLLGGHRLKGVVATFPAPEHENPRGMDSRNGNLGMDILHHFNLTIDYAGSKMYVEPNSEFGAPFEWDMSGLTLDFEADGSCTVAAVIPGSPAAESGIQEGDALVAVDGKPIDQDDAVRLREYFRRPGAEVSIRFRRGEKDDTVRIRLRRLV